MHDSFSADQPGKEDKPHGRKSKKSRDSTPVERVRPSKHHKSQKQQPRQDDPSESTIARKKGRTSQKSRECSPLEHNDNHSHHHRHDREQKEEESRSLTHKSLEDMRSSKVHPKRNRARPPFHGAP